MSFTTLWYSQPRPRWILKFTNSFCSLFLYHQLHKLGLFFLFSIPPSLLIFSNPFLCVDFTVLFSDLSSRALILLLSVSRCCSTCPFFSTSIFSNSHGFLRSFWDLPECSHVPLFLQHFWSILFVSRYETHFISIALLVIPLCIGFVGLSLQFVVSVDSCSSGGLCPPDTGCLFQIPGKFTYVNLL